MWIAEIKERRARNLPAVQCSLALLHEVERVPEDDLNLSYGFIARDDSPSWTRLQILGPASPEYKSMVGVVIVRSLQTSVLLMGLLRILSGLVEIVGAVACLRYNSVATALRINSLIGLAGPVFFLLVGSIGVFAIASRLSPVKIAALCLGMLLVLWGTSGLQ